MFPVNCKRSTGNFKKGSIPFFTGFTFLELLIVLLVVGLLTAASVPCFKTFCENMRLQAGARLTLNLLRQARADAIANHRTTCLVIPTSGDDWLDLHYKAMKIVYLHATLESGTEVYRTISGWEYLPKGIEIDSSSTVFNTTIEITYPGDYADGATPIAVACAKFKPNGAATDNATIRIWVADDHSKLKNIRYDNLSGRAKIE